MRVKFRRKPSFCNTKSESVFLSASMTDAVIGSLCERFTTRLKENSSFNYNRHRFFRNGTVKKVFESNQQDLRELLRSLCQANGTPLTQVPDLLRRTLTDLSLTFAILLFARGRQERDVVRQFVDLALATGADRFADTKLPIPLETATFRFPLQGVEFYHKQFRFCTVTLMKREEVVYEEYRLQCPLPYLQETKIGEGAFGQVWKVRIEEQHFQSRSERTANTEALELARKDFQLRREGRGEQEILDKILDQPRRHKNIMVALASLQYGPTYSLFFPLASCNLWQYLNGVYSEDRFPPSTWEEKKDIYSRGVTLAGALAFLHHEFRNQKLEVFSCYHLDLKPHNILVFDAYGPSETWKITDFGLSRVKGRGLDGEADVELVMPIIGRGHGRQRHIQEPSTLNRRGEGTYLAPECSLPSGRVSSASDVWSFGCIISLVMSYIDSGYSGVVAFARQRRRQDHGDKFYTIRHGKPKLSPVVIAWYEKLKHRARASSFAMEHEVVSRTLDFLQKYVLHPIRDQRVSSREVEDTLASISGVFHRRPSETRSRWRLRRPSFSSAYTPSYEKLHIETSVPILGTAFAPGGDLLLFQSQQKVQVFFLDEILSAVEQLPKPRVINIPRASLECVASSSGFICVCLARACFECVFYETTTSSESQGNSILQGSRVYYPHMGSIKNVAMSADGLLTAFVIVRTPGGSDSDALLYLSTTQDLLNNASEGGILPRL
ncbi:kinase-like domain-containing protein [Aspergillus pseudotamarii]|uniref:Kinase-like domain-containing protein n=1 Tax=Aspergillus pseudotamarii TaxID=132259 RepID=A0A5N6S9M7_ASPPS|nr:kinase-like domain-containing protein [Aspergillus pseudotamarii]KAE8131255.1 kinase-like domain-containing protein [Aspergillus pseudotamarii]